MNISKLKPTKLVGKFPHHSLSTIKDVHSLIESLPLHSSYNIEQEQIYLSKISSLIVLIQKLRLQFIPYAVTQEGLKKLFVQLGRQSSHKEIILAALADILKGFQDYIEVIDGELFEIIELMLQMQEDQINSLPSSRINLTLDQQSAIAMELASQQFVKSVVKWYRTVASGRKVAQKYEKLIKR